MDTTIFIAWFIFHNISGSAKKCWLIIAFRWSVKLIQNMPCRFLPEGTPLPLPHRPILPIDCAAAKCKLIMFHAYPWLWKRYTNVYIQVMWFRLRMIDEPTNILVRSLSEHEQLNFAPKFWTNQKIWIRLGYLWILSLVENQHGLNHSYSWG